jgi:hypothetical protein
LDFEWIEMIIKISFSIDMAAIGIKYPIVKSLSSVLLFSSILCIFKMIIGYSIHGMVYELTEKIYLTFDSLDVSVDCMDENIFRELLYFKTQTSDSKFGFTIAGLVPFRKITLLSVSFEN